MFLNKTIENRMSFLQAQWQHLCVMADTLTACRCNLQNRMSSLQAQWQHLCAMADMLTACRCNLANAASHQKIPFSLDFVNFSL